MKDTRKKVLIANTFRKEYVSLFISKEKRHNFYVYTYNIFVFPNNTRELQQQQKFFILHYCRKIHHHSSPFTYCVFVVVCFVNHQVYFNNMLPLYSCYCVYSILLYLVLDLVNKMPHKIQKANYKSKKLYHN